MEESNDLSGRLKGQVEFTATRASEWEQNTWDIPISISISTQAVSRGDGSGSERVGRCQCGSGELLLGFSDILLHCEHSSLHRSRHRRRRERQLLLEGAELLQFQDTALQLQLQLGASGGTGATAGAGGTGGIGIHHWRSLERGEYMAGEVRGGVVVPRITCGVVQWCSGAVEAVETTCTDGSCSTSLVVSE
jgi:hypothetical protein